MNKQTYGALKRIVEEVKEKRSAKCLFIDCIINHKIGGNDIDLVESWINEVAKEYNDEGEKHKEEIYKMSIFKIFEEINRDRNNEWSEYDQNTTLKELIEGIDEFMN